MISIFIKTAVIFFGWVVILTSVSLAQENRTDILADELTVKMGYDKTGPTKRWNNGQATRDFDLIKNKEPAYLHEPGLIDDFAKMFTSAEPAPIPEDDANIRWATKCNLKPQWCEAEKESENDRDPLPNHLPDKR